MLAELRSHVCEYVKRLDTSALTAADALSCLREVSMIENAAATAKALFAARLNELQAHRQTGDRSTADLLAKQTGTTVGAARDQIDTGKRLEDQPDLNDAARNGEVSPQQTMTISDAAAADPSAEKKLLNQVRDGASLNELRDEANKIKAAALPDREARRKKIHDERHIRSWTDAEGAGNLRVRDNPEVIASLMARIDGRDRGDLQPTPARGHPRAARGLRGRRAGAHRGR